MELTELRAFFARSPFMADLGVEPVAVGEGSLSLGEAEIFAESQGQRTLVMKTSATMALVQHQD